MPAKKINDLILADQICDLTSTDKEEALAELVTVLSKSKNVSEPAVVLQAVYDREKVISTGIGIGVAVPHVKIPQISDFAIAIGRSIEGIEYQALDDKPVHLIIMIAANDKQAGDYLKILAEVIKRCKNADKREAILKAQSPNEIAKVFLS